MPEAAAVTIQTGPRETGRCFTDVSTETESKTAANSAPTRWNRNPMNLLSLLILSAQVFFAVHAIRTGRDRLWLWIIILFPGIGSLVYFFAEYLGDLQGNYKFRKMKTGVVQALNPAGRLRELEQQAELTPSVKNKKLLAEEYVNRGMFRKAIDLFHECMADVGTEDPFLVKGLSLAHFFQGDYEAAMEQLEKLQSLEGTPNDHEFDLLYTRCLEELGRNREALDAYGRIVNHYPGEEARCRFALLLKRTGNPDEANRHFDEILRNVRLSPGFYKKAQKKWANIAKKEKTS